MDEQQMKSTDGQHSGRPKQYDFILGITSLWLLLPASYGFVYISNPHNNDKIGVGILSTWTMICSTISTLMWKNNIKNSLLWKCDIICARTHFILLILYYAFFCNFSLFVQITFPLCVSICYIFATILYRKQEWLLNLFVHVIFRYIGYIWTHIGLVKHHYTLQGIIFLSCIYYFHIFILLVMLYDVHEFDINEKYIEGILNIFVIICFSSFIYFYYF